MPSGCARLTDALVSDGVGEWKAEVDRLVDRKAVREVERERCIEVNR